MFERFKVRAPRSCGPAQDEDRHFLLREDEGVAAQALYSLNVVLDEVREQVESIAGYGKEGTEKEVEITQIE
jgi:ATP-dependent Clp protease ATP-binding subunit ClpC